MYIPFRVNYLYGQIEPVPRRLSQCYLMLIIRIVASFYICIATARQNCGGQISISSFASYTIVIRNGCTSPINLHSISRFMCDTHSCFCEPCPFAIFVTKLRVHVWRQLRCIAIRAVFRP